MAFDADALDSTDDDWTFDDDGTPDRGPVDPSGPAVIFVSQSPRAYPESQNRVAYRPLRSEPGPYLRGRGQAMPSRFSNARALDGFARLPQAGSEAGAFASRDRLRMGESLSRGQSIRSPNGQYTLIFQTDGNLVLYKENGHVPLWDSGTVGRGAQATMQTDGNFVVYDGNRSAVWASNSVGKTNAFLVVQDDGNLVMYADGGPFWATNSTGGVVSHDMSGKSFLSKVGSAVQTALPIAQQVISMVPGVGSGVNAAIAAGVSLAQGHKITDALVSAAKSAIPGGPIAQSALEHAYNIARGGSITKEVAGAIRDQVATTPAAKAAFDTGLALAHGRNLQEAALGGAKTMAQSLSPFAARALSSVGPTIGNMVSRAPVDLLAAGPKSVAMALLHNPSWRSLPIAELARRVNVPEYVARDGVAALVSSVSKAGGSSLPMLAPASALARRMPTRSTFDQLLAQNASHASAIAFSPDMKRAARREVRWHKNTNGRLAQVIMNPGASGLVDAGAIGDTLQEGSKGADVLTWQKFLASTVGLDYSSGPGTFGPKTTAATKAYQTSRGLPADGVVGPLTWASMASAPAPATPPPAPPAVVAMANSTPVIQEGSKGAAVLVWQKFLASTVGLDYSSGPGTFGPRTTAATKQYQKSRGLLADGVVGAKTWASMASAPPATPATAPPVSPLPGAVPAPTPAAATVATYLVTSRDVHGLSGIAKDFTGNANRWTELAKSNPQVKPTAYVIHAGDVLTLPASWGASPKAPTTAPPSLPNIGKAIGDVVSALPPGVVPTGPVSLPPSMGGGPATPPITPSPATPQAGVPTPAVASSGGGSGIAILGLIGAGLAAAQSKLF